MIVHENGASNDNNKYLPKALQQSVYIEKALIDGVTGSLTKGGPPTGGNPPGTAAAETADAGAGAADAANEVFDGASGKKTPTGNSQNNSSNASSPSESSVPDFTTPDSIMHWVNDTTYWSKNKK